MPRQVQLNRGIRFLRTGRARHRHRHPVLCVRGRGMRLPQPDRQLDLRDTVIVLRLPGKLYPVLRARFRRADKFDGRNRVRQHRESIARPLAPPAHADPRIAGDRRLRFPGAVRRRGKVCIPVARALHHKPRRSARFGSQGHFRAYRYTDILAAGLQENRRAARMLRRRHPGLDDHLVGANQRAIVRKQGAPHAPWPVPARKHREQDDRRGQDGPHVERIKRLPLCREARKAKVPELSDQPGPMGIPEACRLGRGISGAILQRGQRPHFRRRFEHPGRLRLGRRRVALCTAPGERRAHRKDQRRQ